MEMNEDKNLRWDLEKILENTSFDDLTQDYFTKLEELTRLYEQDLFVSKERLVRFHTINLECAVIFNKISTYLFNKQSEDLDNTEWFTQEQRIAAAAVPFQQRLSSFEEKVIQNRDIIEEYIKDERLIPLQRFYELIFKNAKHDIPTHVKRYLVAYAPEKGSYSAIFTLLRDRELPIKPAKDSKRDLHIIHNYDTFLKLQLSPDRVLRKNSYYCWFEAMKLLENTFARLLYFQLLRQNIAAKNRNFSGGFYEQKIFEDELTSTFIPYIYKKVARFHPEYRKFKKIQKHRLKTIYQLRGIKPWDTRMPVIQKNDTHVSIEEAKKICLEALQCLGDDYVSTVKKAFDDRWIDWLSRPGKSSGAYCSGGSYGVEGKYIFLNFNHTIDDVFTLIHELGHAVHAVEFCNHQSYFAESTIFTAEIPSTLNELLLSFHLLDVYKNQPERQLEIYDQLISNFFSTTITQIIFSDWEYEANRLVNEGRVLDAATAKLIYKAKQEKYQGNRITKPLSPWKELALTSILNIPHFYSGEFYVYKYAIGQVVSLIVAVELYYNKSTETMSRYLEFLRSGTSRSNLETIRLLDINLERTATWVRVREIVKKWVNEYYRLSQVA